LTFKVNEEWLREGTGDMMDDEVSLSDYEKRLLELFNELTPLARKMLIEYAEKLVADEKGLRGETPESIKQAPGDMRLVDRIQPPKLAPDLTGKKRA
jgi:hypothetical protein